MESSRHSDLQAHDNPAFRCPQNLLETLAVVELPYRDMHGLSQRGEMVVAERIADKVQAIFEALYDHRFPIASIKPVREFGWDDEQSMRANNTSAFNYRYIGGTERLSNHAFGLAIDINPWLNPQLIQGKPYPSRAVYDPGMPGTITPDSLVVSLFAKHGATWGGVWKTNPDYQHFEFS